MPRHNHLIEKRNQDIVERFKHWYDIKRLRYEDVIVRLSEDFYISERRIKDVLRNAKKQAKEES